MPKQKRQPGIHLHKTTAIENEGEQIIIGKSEFFERMAWQNAKNWIREQNIKNQKTN